MTPKEKAIYLYEEFYYKLPSTIDSDFTDNLAINLALIAVDEIIENLVDLSNGDFTFIHNVEYWQEVKEEINRL